MTDNIDLPDAVMARAAQDFFATEWASAREAAGFRFRPGTEITADCPPQDPATLLRLIRLCVARLARAWGMGVGEMFALMEIPQDEWSDALYYVLMSCRGHGVSLADDFGPNIEIAESNLGRGIDLSPFHDDFIDFYILASEVVETDARRPDDDPDPHAPFRPGDRVRVATPMPTGDRLTGTGTVVRWIAQGDPLNASEGAIVAMDDDEQVEPWCYRGMAVFVGRCKCEAIAQVTPGKGV
jgi:hypothetical protein